jgi:hypothetical protein
MQHVHHPVPLLCGQWQSFAGEAGRQGSNKLTPTTDGKPVVIYRVQLRPMACILIFLVYSLVDTIIYGSEILRNESIRAFQAGSVLRSDLCNGYLFLGESNQVVCAERGRIIRRDRFSDNFAESDKHFPARPFL